MISINPLLGAYSIAWLLAFYLYKRNNSMYTLGGVILLFYTILSVASIIAFSDKSAYLVFKRELTAFPLFYLIALLLLSFWPILSLKEKKLQFIEIPSYQIANVVCIFFSVFSLIYIIDIHQDIQNGFFIMQWDNSDITQLYDDAKEIRMASKTRSAFTNYAGVFGNIGAFINPLLFYTYLLYDKRNKFVLILLGLALLQEPFRGIAQANRLYLVTNILLMFFMFFFFKPFLSFEIRKRIMRIGIIVASFFLLVLSVITVARVLEKNETSILFNVTRYMGESPIVFDQYCLNANGTRDGYSVGPLLHLLVGDKVLTEKEIRSKYSSLGIDNSRFYTYIGDFVLDYGPISTVIIMIILTLIFRSYLDHNQGLGYGQVILVYVLTKAYTGYYLYVYNTLSGNIFLVVAFIFCLLFSLKVFPTIRINKNL